MSKEQILIIHSDTEIGQLLERNILRPAGYDVTYVRDRGTATMLTKPKPPDLVIIGDQVVDNNNDLLVDGLELAADLLERFPALPVILFTDQNTEDRAVSALRLGVADYLQPPLRSNELIQSVRRALQRSQRLRDWVGLAAKRDTKSLQQRVNGLEALQRVGRTVTALLDLDSVLTAVVDAAVELTGAEEGSLLLLDESSGELYMRASRNFGEDFVRTFRVPIQDTLPGQVLRTGKPILLDEKTPQKIKTAYLVHTLMYAPLMVQDHAIGVLGVDNRQSGHPFTDYHLALVSALADYAAIAIENSRLFSNSEVERNKLETILTSVKEGVIVVDHDRRLLLINPTAREAFGVEDGYLIGKPAQNIIQHTELLDILVNEDLTSPYRSEITLEDGRVLNTLVTPIPDVGLAVTMQEITHLKELDRIKSDFVNTVSHDLRSPLTAILGYVELIDRVGPTSEEQKEFIRRIELSVQSIATLVNDLLDLGRIEAGFDTRKEIVPLSSVIRYAVEGLKARSAEKEQDLILELPEDMPNMLGNPIRLRQMFTNLIGNAIKYTQNEGEIKVHARVEGKQIVLKIIDNGPGIPSGDQPYIFDKFYRASNIPSDAPGTGLGLAIVKSIVENHQGRIWVDSVLGQGTTFIVVLPVLDEDL
jgi:PAS domain S-box-containing protein